MNHSIQLKLPKLFGKKKVEETEEKLEVKHSVELKLPEIFSKDEVKETEGTKINKKQLMITSGVVVVGFTMGYLVGHHKGTSRAPQNIFIMK